jgi:hypothetical protein
MNALFSRSLVYYVLMAAVRDRLILSLILFMAVGTCLAVFLGSSAVIEADQFALVFAASGLRLAGIAGLVLFAVFYTRRAFDTKDIDYLLSRPINRAGFILSHMAAFSLLAGGVALFAVVAAALLAGHSIIISGFTVWAISLIVEFVIIINTALFFSMVLSSAAGASLAVIGLYVLSRMIGQIFGIIDAATAGKGAEFMGHVMQIVSLIVPRLDLMAQTTWLVYGPGPHDSLVLILLQGIVYTALLAAASIFDLRRRQF